MNNPPIECPHGCQILLDEARVVTCGHGWKFAPTGERTPPPSADNLAGDYAMAHIAHTIRTYYLALKAEGFTTIEAIAIASNYQAALLGTAATMPPISPTPDT